MIVRKCALAVVLAAVGLGVVACGERIEAGLANAPSLERKSEPKFQNDVITVGAEGCTGRDGGPTVATGTLGCDQNTSAFLADASGPSPSR
jgi:hypothetical protein